MPLDVAASEGPQSLATIHMASVAAALASIEAEAAWHHRIQASLAVGPSTVEAVTSSLASPFAVAAYRRLEAPESAAD